MYEEGEIQKKRNKISIKLSSIIYRFRLSKQNKGKSCCFNTVT